MMTKKPTRYTPGNDEHTKGVVAHTCAFLTDLRAEDALVALGGDPERVPELGISGALEEAIRPLLPGNGDAGYEERMEAGWTRAEAQTIQRWIGIALQAIIALPVSTSTLAAVLDQAAGLVKEWQVEHEWA